MHRRSLETRIPRMEANDANAVDRGSAMNRQPASGSTESNPDVVQFVRGDVWRFGFCVAILLCVEVLALLQAWRVLPYIKGFLGYTFVLMMLSGWWLETDLAKITGRYLVAADDALKPMERCMALGLMYVVPPVYAVCGWVIAWSAWVSVVVFAALAARVVWIWTRRRARS